MGEVIVIGGGIIGLSMAMMLAEGGVNVTVVEQDGEPVPDSPALVWSRWGRRGVGQFHQPHMMLARGLRILRDRVPEVAAHLEAAGASRFTTLMLMPPGIEDRRPRPGDSRFDTLAARRPLLEWSAARAAARLVTVRRGVRVTGLVAGPSTVDGVPHVVGVRTAAGEEIRADLVIDASGRRSDLPGWLTELGAKPPLETTEGAKTSYYTRFFRGDLPALPAGSLIGDFDSYSVITLPADHGHWSVSVVLASTDRELKRVSRVDNWTTLVRACPVQARFLDGEPEGGLRILGGTVARLRRFVIDGTPTATGVLAVGDAVATTNPHYGRGITLGLIQAAGTADVVRAHLADPPKLAIEHDNMLRDRLIPFYDETVRTSRSRAGAVEAAINGGPVPEPAPQAVRDLIVSAFHDADLFRVLSENVMLLSTMEELLARPGMAERVAASAQGRLLPLQVGPSRRELLRMLAGSHRDHGA